MNALTLYLLEASVCLGVFYLFYLAILHRQPTFRYNRAYLLVTSALGWLLPLLEVPLGWGSGEANGGASAYLLLPPAITSEATETLNSGLPWWEMIYGLGVLIMLTRFAGQFFRLHRMVRGSQPQAVPHQRYRLLYTNGKFPTASFFRYLFWDNTQSLTVEETCQMMTHEEAHIRQGHSYDVLYMTALKTVGWFHPLVYLYEHALIQTHEYAADAAVLPQTSEKAYARLLSKRMLTTRNILPVNHFFYPSQTLNRIQMIYSKTHKTPWYKYVLIVPVFTSLFFTFSCQPDAEEVARESVAQSYEEVNSSLAAIDQEIVRIVDHYYPTEQEYMEAVNNYISRHPGPPPTAAEFMQGTASSAQLRKLEELEARQEQLREKLAHLPDADGVFTVVEHQPEPPNGIREFYQFIGDNIKYPTEARKAGIEGKVFVQFVVNEYGELTDIKTLKGIGRGCDEEAMRVIEESPAWNPGITNGKAVNVRMVLPITFKLDNDKNVSETATEQSSTPDKPKLDEMVVVGYQ